MLHLIPPPLPHLLIPLCLVSINKKCSYNSVWMVWFAEKKMKENGLWGSSRITNLNLRKMYTHRNDPSGEEKKKNSKDGFFFFFGGTIHKISDKKMDYEYCKTSIYVIEIWQGNVLVLGNLTAGDNSIPNQFSRSNWF